MQRSSWSEGSSGAKVTLMQRSLVKFKLVRWSSWWGGHPGVAGGHPGVAVILVWRSSWCDGHPGVAVILVGRSSWWGGHPGGAVPQVLVSPWCDGLPVSLWSGGHTVAEVTLMQYLVSSVLTMAVTESIPGSLQSSGASLEPSTRPPL